MSLQAQASDSAGDGDSWWQDSAKEGLKLARLESAGIADDLDVIVIDVHEAQVTWRSACGMHDVDGGDIHGIVDSGIAKETGEAPQSWIADDFSAVVVNIGEAEVA